MGVASARNDRVTADVTPVAIAIVDPLNFCPSCGARLLDDGETQSTVFQSIAVCETCRIRFTYSVWTRRMEVEFLAS
jgi:hypothetical protein